VGSRRRRSTRARHRVGHLLECAGQLCGGYFADPDAKDIPAMAHLGFPYADVTPDGDAVVSQGRRHRRADHAARPRPSSCSTKSPIRTVT
jgi:hypothetical protein